MEFPQKRRGNSCLKDTTCYFEFNILHNINCQSNWIIYLSECNLCKIQYVRKSVGPFNIRLNNHRKDVIDTNAIGTENYFILPSQDLYNTNAKSIIIDQLINRTNIILGYVDHLAHLHLLYCITVEDL